MVQDKNRLYDIVALEIAQGDIKPGVWTRAYSEAAGIENVAKAIYIKLRTEQLASEELIRKRSSRRKATKKAVEGEQRMDFLA